MKNSYWSRSYKITRLAGSFGLATLLGVASTADSLWDAGESKSMFSDRKARQVGDIITIVVQENSTSSKEKSTKTGKKTGLDASLDTFLFSPDASGLLTHKGKLPAIKYSTGSSFDGGGQIKNSEQITTRIAARVIDVLPNDSLIIEGRRQTMVSGERQEVVLRGLVRIDDVMGNNTVFSYNLADASIQFISKGVISETEKKGWFTKLWDKVTPF